MRLQCPTCGSEMVIDCTEQQAEYQCSQCDKHITLRKTAYKAIGPEPATKEALAEYDAAVARQRLFQKWSDD